MKLAVKAKNAGPQISGRSRCETATNKAKKYLSKKRPPQKSFFGVVELATLGISSPFCGRNKLSRSSTPGQNGVESWAHKDKVSRYLAKGLWTSFKNQEKTVDVP